MEKPREQSGKTVPRELLSARFGQAAQRLFRSKSDLLTQVEQSGTLKKLQSRSLPSCPGVMSVPYFLGILNIITTLIVGTNIYNHPITWSSFLVEAKTLVLYSLLENDVQLQLLAPINGCN